MSGKELSNAQCFKMLQSVAAFGTYASCLMDKRTTLEGQRKFCYDRFHGLDNGKVEEQRRSMLDELLKGEGRLAKIWVIIQYI